MSELDHPPIGETSSAQDEAKSTQKQIRLVIRDAVPLPFPDDYFDPIEDIEWHPFPVQKSHTIQVKIVAVNDSKPLPYPLDDESL